jgi:hypothetical protein
MADSFAIEVHFTNGVVMRGMEPPDMQAPAQMLSGAEMPRVVYGVASPLTSYFTDTYESGEELVVDGYSGERLPESTTKDHMVEAYALRAEKRKKISGVSSVPVQLHERSGIFVAEYPVDLRCRKGSVVILYHYTSIARYIEIMGEGKTDEEVVKSLLFNDEGYPFGKGIYATAKSPDQFGSKEAVLLNNHWPCCGNASQPPGHESNELERGGGEGTGPQDPDNAKVCAGILSNDLFRGRADFCIPIMVHAEDVYDIWVRCMPGLNVEYGCNRWGEVQWPGRDVRVISTSGLTTQGSRIGDRRLQIMQKRVKFMEDKWGSKNLESLLSLGILAFSLSGVRQDVQAEPFMRRWLVSSEDVLGREHEFTLIAMGNLAFTLRNLKKFDEALSLAQTRLSIAERVLGKHHPITIASLRGLRRTHAAMSETDKAIELMKDEYARTNHGQLPVLLDAAEPAQTVEESRPRRLICL